MDSRRMAQNKDKDMEDMVADVGAVAVLQEVVLQVAVLQAVALVEVALEVALAQASVEPLQVFLVQDNPAQGQSLPRPFSCSLLKP